MKIYILNAGGLAPEVYRHRSFAYASLSCARADMMAWGREHYGEAELPRHVYHLGDAVEGVGEIDAVEWVGDALPS